MRQITLAALLNFLRVLIGVTILLAVGFSVQRTWCVLSFMSFLFMSRSSIELNYVSADYQFFGVN
jgi:hypothetical protein